MAKLTIGYRYSFGKSKPKAIAKVRSFLDEMDRVEKLKLIANRELFEEISRHLPKSAPQLHTLYIGSSSTFSMDEDLFHDTERLRRVELSNCVISWDSRLLTGLTTLTLEHSGWRSLDRYPSWKTNSSIIQVLHALQRMPALTNLRLINSIPDNPEVLSTYPVVDLPCLRLLCISSYVGALTTVLRHITIPHNAILNLSCRDKQYTQIDFSNILSVLTRKFLSSLVIRGLGLQLLETGETNGVKFFLSTNAIIQNPSSLFSQYQVRLSLTWPSPHPHNHEKALTCVFDAMSWPFLTRLYIKTENFLGSEDYVDSETWVKTFGKLLLVEKVYAKGCGIKSFLEALVYKTKEAEKSETSYQDVSFPKLRHIGLRDTPILIDMLLDCLMERWERKAEVQELCLNNCYCVSSSKVERLREVVVDVNWDGIEQELHDF